MRIACYGVRPLERSYFEKLNKYDYDLKLITEYLNRENVVQAEDCDAVLVRGNCLCDRTNLEQFKNYGISWVFTRSVGVDHFDLEAAKDLGISVARVPNYSPYAVANLAFTLGLTLSRHVGEAAHHVHEQDFGMHPDYFATEFNRLKVGIYGAGKIGAVEGKMWQALGAEVYAYDPFPSDFAKQYCTFVTEDELLATCDIVSVHVPYFPGKNDKLMNAEFIAKMKEGAVLVNTARGELADEAAIAAAVSSNHLSGYGADVVSNEKKIMGHNFDCESDVPDQEVQSLMDLYPRVLLTPHMGSFTEPALEDMISLSFNNFHNMATEGAVDARNEVVAAPESSTFVSEKLRA